MVGGVGVYDRHLVAIARESFRKYESRLEFTYLTDLGMPALIERLKHLPDHTIVYHTSIMQDADGTHFIDASQSVPMIASAARAPVFIVDDVDLGKRNSRRLSGELCRYRPDCCPNGGEGAQR